MEIFVDESEKKKKKVTTAGDNGTEFTRREVAKNYKGYFIYIFARYTRFVQTLRDTIGKRKKISSLNCANDSHNFSFRLVEEKKIRLRRMKTLAIER